MVYRDLPYYEGIGPKHIMKENKHENHANPLHTYYSCMNQYCGSWFAVKLFIFNWELKTKMINFLYKSGCKGHQRSNQWWNYIKKNLCGVFYSFVNNTVNLGSFAECYISSQATFWYFSYSTSEHCSGQWTMIGCTLKTHYSAFSSSSGVLLLHLIILVISIFGSGIA